MYDSTISGQSAQCPICGQPDCSLNRWYDRLAAIVGWYRPRRRSS